MIKNIDHIGIAVRDLDEAIKIYSGKLGLKTGEIEVIGEHGSIRAVMIEAGDSRIELLESKDPENSIGQFLNKQGDGMHHLALGVSDIKSTMADLKEKGMPFIDENPRPGPSGMEIAFMHPEGAKILLELVERHE